MNDTIGSCFAERTGSLAASLVRELFADTLTPDVISFAGGLPDISPTLTAQLTQSAAKVTARNDRSIWQYGSGDGSEEMRERIAEVMHLEHTSVSADNIVVTTGSQNALELLAKLVLDPGDIVLVDTPCYITALLVFKSFQAQIIHVNCDKNGMVLESLEETVADLKARNLSPKLLYTVTNFNNPSGVTLAGNRRERLLEICLQNDILLLEDNPYGLVNFGDTPPPTLRSYSEKVVYTGTFSKILTPGFRIGWIVAPDNIRSKLILANECAVLSPSTFGQAVVSQYLKDYGIKEHLKTSCDLYRSKRDSMLAALRQYLPDYSYAKPAGGFFFWLPLPEEIDARKLLQDAFEKKVIFVPGSEFFSDPDKGKHFLRLNFSFPKLEDIPEGIRRLKNVIDAHL